ncbi:MAG: thiamine phosphate synthase [Thermomonas sp.]|nr:MAG: thiamine phosphate synthase [Thermomonas sp.]
MRKHRLQRGLYLITPDARDPSRLLERVLPLLPFAACLQLRAKSMDDSLLRDAGARLREACADARVPFIVNDDARLAQELDADGVHLGEHDGGIAGARALLGENAIIGVSCYDDLERARTLTAQGADYLAFGAFFPSPTKPHARRASLDLLRDSAVFGLPRVAIGGITPDNAGPLVAAGADLLAVISGVFDAPDPIKAARAYLSCLQDESA